MLPAEKLNAFRSLLEEMVEPLSRSLALAPVEEEEITPETAAALDRARASLARGGRRPCRDPARVRAEVMSEEAASERIVVIWSPEARVDVRARPRDGNADSLPPSIITASALEYLLSLSVLS